MYPVQPPKPPTWLSCRIFTHTNIQTHSSNTHTNTKPVFMAVNFKGGLSTDYPYSLSRDSKPVSSKLCEINAEVKRSFVRKQKKGEKVYVKT